MSNYSVETKQLRRTYSSVKKQPGLVGSVRSLFKAEKVELVAVKGIDMSVRHGEIVGFLGPNGAGKTTTLKMLSGILHPSSGEAKVLGHTPHHTNPEMLRQIALVMGNKQQLWWDLPAWDGFQVLKELYEVPEAAFKARLDKLVDTLDVGDKIHTQLRKLSLGERMKCELIAALLHNPKVVFLDEPTLGLDVVSQKRIRDFLKEYHEQENCTILLTSHYMQDVRELCERVVVIDHGSLVFEGTLDTLSARFADTRRVRLTLDQVVPKEDLDRLGKVVESTNEQVVYEVPRAETAELTASLLKSLPVADVAIEEVDIEAVMRDLFSQDPSTSAV